MEYQFSSLIEKKSLLVVQVDAGVCLQPRVTNACVWRVSFLPVRAASENRPIRYGRCLFTRMYNTVLLVLPVFSVITNQMCREKLQYVTQACDSTIETYRIGKIQTNDMFV